MGDIRLRNSKLFNEALRKEWNLRRENLRSRLIQYNGKKLAGKLTELPKKLLSTSCISKKSKRQPGELWKNKPTLHHYESTIAKCILEHTIENNKDSEGKVRPVHYKTDKKEFYWIRHFCFCVGFFRKMYLNIKKDTNRNIRQKQNQKSEYK